MKAKDTQAKASNAADRGNKSDRVDNIDRVNRVSKVLNVSNDNHTQHTKHGWEVKKLGKVCESDLGKTLNQSKDKGLLRPYLCAINVLWDKFDLTTLKETRFEDSELERYSVKKGDLLICEGGDIGRAAIWNSDIVMLYQNALHRVRLNKSINSRFVLLYLRHLKKSRILDTRYGKGVTIKHLVKSSLLSIPIPIPPMDEQERIVRELDCLSGVIERKREQLKQLDALAQSIFYDMFGDPISNEKGWEVKKLKTVSILLNGRAYKQNELLDSGKYKVLRVGNFFTNSNYYYSDLELEEDKYCDDGDLLFAWSASFGAFIWNGGKVIYHYHIWKVLYDKQMLNIHYYRFLLNTMTTYFMKDVHGIGMVHLTKAGMEQYNLPIPPLPLQQEFAEKIEAIEKQKELLKRSIKEVETLFDARMDYYFGDT